uniref:Uncharacterized protein n=1 Tax=uncultured Thiotrichaceae bacterium TaxID=298394 RepID=A0A6S6S559_9GAMM|nr:MAG: Unknown protein [uncultured Thiotrichaceae bacterium]
MKDHNAFTKKNPYSKYIKPPETMLRDSVEDLEAGIEQGLADAAAGKVMSSDECFDRLKRLISLEGTPL